MNRAFWGDCASCCTQADVVGATVVPPPLLGTIGDVLAVLVGGAAGGFVAGPRVKRERDSVRAVHRRAGDDAAAISAISRDFRGAPGQRRTPAGWSLCQRPFTGSISGTTQLHISYPAVRESADGAQRRGHRSGYPTGKRAYQRAGPCDSNRVAREGASSGCPAETARPAGRSISQVQRPSSGGFVTLRPADGNFRRLSVFGDR